MGRREKRADRERGAAEEEQSGGTLQATADEIEPDPDTLPEPVTGDDTPWQPGDTLTKPEACELLGKSERTLARLMSDRKIAFRLINGKAIFQRADVERLKADLETPVVSGAVVPILPGMAVSPAVSNDADGNVQPTAATALARIEPALMTFVDYVGAATAALLERSAPTPPPRPGLERWMDLKAAREYSGLSRKWLLAQARSGVPWAINDGTAKNEKWMFRLADTA
jgi:hypothetical protein